MLCTSILSEVVLGFLLWSGWLGATQTAEVSTLEYAPNPVAMERCGVPVGAVCPQACVGYPVPACYPQPCVGYALPACYPQPAQACAPTAFGVEGRTSPNHPMPAAVPMTRTITGDIEILKVLSLPSHLAACDVKEVFNREAGTSMPCKKPCSWKIESVVESRTSDGIEVEITLDAVVAGAKEAYKASKRLVYDRVTDVTLLGGHPEPVCIRVVARGAIQPMVMPATDVVSGSQVWSLPAPMCCPMPTYPAAPAAWNSHLPEPLPVNTPPAYASPSYAVTMPVVSTVPTLPAPTPIRRASVKLVYEAGKPRLRVQSEGMTTECVRMKLEAGAAGAVRLSAGKNRVHLAGTRWKAEADRVEVGDEGRIVLAGHVKLLSDKLGVCAAVKAERLCVQVKGGKFEKLVESK